MEVLGGVASVIAVIQLTSVLVRVLKIYYCGTREARSDIKRLFSTISSLELLLRQIDALPESGYTASLKELLKDPNGPLELLQVELEEVQLAITAPKKGKKKLGSLAQSLKWPLKSDGVNKTVGVIERHRTTLNSHLGVGMIGLQIKNLDILSIMQNDLGEAHDDRRRQKIIRWLSKGLPDPSAEHNSRREEHESGTAGTGKNVMCSTVIEHLQHRSRMQHGLLSVVSYWYFSFANKPTLNISSALCSIARDLFSKSLVIPGPVEETWSDSNHGQQRPSAQGLFKMLVSLLNHFDNVYLVIDAVDEHTDSSREQLLKVLSGLMSLGAKSLHLFVSSRPNVEIERTFRQHATGFDFLRCITLHPDCVQKDILKYLEKKLNQETCRKWNAMEKVEIKTRLSTKGAGMFRLVVLQWDTIRKCHSTAHRRKALTELPHTLYESYDQEMAKLEGHHLLAVQKALTWLLFAVRPLTIVELAEASILSPGISCVDYEERLDEPERFLAIIPSSFIRIDKGSRMFNDELTKLPDFSTVQLGHHSIKDYLMMQPFWALNADGINSPILNYLLHVTHEVDLESETSLSGPSEDFPLLSYIIDNSDHHFSCGNKHDLILVRSLRLGLLTLHPRPSGENLVPLSQIGRYCSQGRPCSQCACLFHLSFYDDFTHRTFELGSSHALITRLETNFQATVFSSGQSDPIPEIKSFNWLSPVESWVQNVLHFSTMSEPNTTPPNELKLLDELPHTISKEVLKSFGTFLVIDLLHSILEESRNYSRRKHQNPQKILHYIKEHIDIYKERQIGVIGFVSSLAKAPQDLEHVSRVLKSEQERRALFSSEIKSKAHRWESGKSGIR